jgi:hypothetical protein
MGFFLQKRLPVPVDIFLNLLHQSFIFRGEKVLKVTLGFQGLRHGFLFLRLWTKDKLDILKN